MNSRTYWAIRETRNRIKNKKEEKQYDKEIEKIYQNMIDEINKEINGFYSRYATKEGITMAEAKKRVAKIDMEEYERKAKKYVKEKNFSEQANTEMRLYNLTMKINRLEMLKARIGLEMVSGFDELQKYYDEILTKRTLDEFERKAGILGKSVSDPRKAAEVIVNASFKNATSFDRIWMYQGMLKSELDKLLQTGLIQGQNPRVLARHLKERFGVSQYNAERLMRTEMARVQSEASKRSMEENGFEEYEFMAEGTACPICRALDGKHFRVKDMLPGTNAAPMHPNCRCADAPYMDRKAFENWMEEKSIEKDSGSGIMKSGAISGALTDKNDPLHVKRDNHASTYYESIRNSKKEPIVKSISKHSGLSEIYISKVYDHVFMNEYELYGGMKRFEPDYYMTESFRRLREGKDIQEHDIILLKHEHLEYGLMNKLGLSYDEAHNLAQSKYDYAYALDEFKKKNNL
ncbi:MAG: minor capsid protein [Sellimonas intestinalis]|uniref:minor capsid protein n=1 Tax=Sellimonas intestinalis TaxID=1653434 RepID=UPI003990F3F3